MEEEQAFIEIMRRCDARINSHTRIIIAEAFGLFSILTLLRGRALGSITFETGALAAFLSITYFGIVLLILYSLARSIHYTTMAEIATQHIVFSRVSEEGKKVNITLQDLGSEMFDAACSRVQTPARISGVIQWRRRRPYFIYRIGYVALIFSVLLWLVVLLLP